MLVIVRVHGCIVDMRACWLPGLKESARPYDSLNFTHVPAMLCAHDGAVQALLADIDGAASAARAQRPGRAPPQGKYLHMHRVRATSRVGAAAGQLPAHSGRGAQPRGLPAAGAGRQAGRHAGRGGRRPRVCHPEVPAPARLPREKAGKGGNKAPLRQTDCRDLCLHGATLPTHAVLCWLSRCTACWQGAHSRRRRVVEPSRTLWRRGLPVERYTRAQILIAYWGISLYWGARDPDPGAQRARRPHSAAFRSSQAGRPQAGATGVYVE